MNNYYEYYIKPKNIKKDINFFYNKICHLIENKLFPEYLILRKKNIKNNNFFIENFLSQYDNTKLSFSDDKIKVNFITNEYRQEKNIILSDLIFKKDMIHDLHLDINIYLTKDEIKNKIIYKTNTFYLDLRKNIHLIYEYFNVNIIKSEECKYKYINYRINKIKKSYYYDWNKLIIFIKDCIDPEFNNNLNKLSIVIKGTKFEKLDMVYQLIHKTQFYNKYVNSKQIRFKNFLKSLKKECLDDNEILYLSNELAYCFGHKINNYDDSILFIENIINHFNNVCFFKNKIINEYILKNWNYLN